MYSFEGSPYPQENKSPRFVDYIYCWLINNNKCGFIGSQGELHAASIHWSCDPPPESPLPFCWDGSGTDMYMQGFTVKKRQKKRQKGPKIVPPFTHNCDHCDHYIADEWKGEGCLCYLALQLQPWRRTRSPLWKLRLNHSAKIATHSENISCPYLVINCSFE